MFPGNKVLIDDWYVNTSLTVANSVNGDSFGIRSTDPSGATSVNSISQSNNCWSQPGACPASSYPWWDLGTPVHFGKVGQWKVEVLNNGSTVYTYFFNLVPYVLNKNGGDAQSLPALTVTPQALSVRLLNPDGTPAASGKSVNFKITSNPNPKSSSNPGGLHVSSGYQGAGNATTLDVSTDAWGVAKVYLDTGTNQGTYTVAATASTLAPGTTVTFTIPVSSTDPNDTAKTNPKDQGDPADQHSGCVGVPPLESMKSSTDNPINIGTGNKFRVETDYIGAGALPLQFVRYYNSVSAQPGSMGGNWRGSFDRSVAVTTTTTTTKGITVTTTTAKVSRPDGKVYTYTLTNGAWVGDPDITDKLVSVTGGGYSYTCAADNVETFSSAGKLLTISARGGTFTQTLTYDAQGRVATVTDAFGRTMRFGYDATNRISTMTDPANQVYTYSYDARGNLTGVLYPDQKSRGYLYENATFFNALTGITDENGARYATFTYDATGRASSSTLAGNAGLSQVAYYTDGSRVVFDGSGTPRKYTFSVIQGVTRRTGLDNGACTSCGNASMLTAYDTNGFVTSVKDYKGVQTTYVRNSLGLETSRTEAAGTPVARTITTTWHSTYQLPLSIAEPGHTTSFTYDSAGRLLTRTETDTANGATRKWTYTYNSQGLLATVDGPRTDVNDVTTYTYDAQGNVASITNALGQTTQYTSYDAHGHPLTIVDPNGQQITLSHDARGRLLTRSGGGLTTTFTYDAVGQLIRITRPDGAWLSYQYDAAHRMRGVTDILGNSVALTLDNNGNVTTRDVKDPSGTLVRTRSWAYDQLNRVTQEIDAQARVQISYGYDANGNRTVETDALGNATSFAYDQLNRLSTRTDPLNGVTSLVYNPRDNITKVTDPKTLATNYSYDGLSNRTQESGPDAGASNYTFDAAGNVKTRSWANGKSVTYTYDALNRVTTEDYGAGTVVTYQYDNTAGGNYGIGRMTQMSDPSGTTNWTYDQLGRVTAKTQIVGARTLTTAYSYDSFGRLQTQTYPSGRQIGYTYANGLLSALSVDGVEQLSSISWQPFGPLTGWTQPNGYVTSRIYDQDGQLTRFNWGTSDTRYLDYDAKGRLTSSYFSWKSYSYAYDALDRLTSQSNSVGEDVYSYTYDANGNRLTKTGNAGTSTYSYASGTNRLQSISGASTKSFTLDAAGNLVADGAHSFGYDARNRLSSVDAGVQYQINGFGQRVGKSVSGVASYAVSDEQGHILGEYDATGATQETVYLGDMPVMVLKGNVSYYVDADQINAPRVVRDASNNGVWQWETDAFGERQPDPITTPIFTYNPRLPGQIFDSETGLHYNWNRYYDPQLGRYVQSDPIGLAGGINTYAYVGGNPLSFVDPWGLVKDSITASVEAAIVRGDAAYLQGLIESGALNPAQLQLATQGVRSIEIIGRTTNSTSRLAELLNRSNKQIKGAIERCKQQGLPRNGPVRNPDVRVDPVSGEVFPELGGNKLGDSIGNIFDYLP